MSREKDNTVMIRVKYGDLEKTFAGGLQEVWLSINKFFNEFLPSFELSKRLLLSVDLESLAETCEGIIAFSSGDAYLLISKDKLTDNETILLWLLAKHVGFQFSIMESDALSKEELQIKLGKNAKITSTRLRELVKTQMITKTAEDKYKITIFGLTKMQRGIMPRIKARINLGDEHKTKGFR